MHVRGLDEHRLQVHCIGQGHHFDLGWGLLETVVGNIEYSLVNRAFLPLLLSAAMKPSVVCLEGRHAERALLQSRCSTQLGRQAQHHLRDASSSPTRSVELSQVLPLQHQHLCGAGTVCKLWC